MKEEVIKTVIRKMGRELDYRQQSILRDVLHECLNNMQISRKDDYGSTVWAGNEMLLKSFISAKKIEGCSVNTLKYYQSSIQTLLEAIGKHTSEITTNDLRSYFLTLSLFRNFL